MSAEVTVCILDLDGGEMLERCLASLTAQRVQPKQIIVVDNGSLHPVIDRLAPHESLEIIRLDQNRGFAAGMNEAVSKARTPLVALLNNDVELHPEWIGALTPLFDDSAVAAVQSIVMRPDGKVDSAGIGVRRGGFVQIGHGEPPPTPGDVHEVWGVAATAAILRRAAVGARPFAEELFAWYEDVELAAGLRREGWRALLLTTPLAVHLGSATASRLPLRGEPMRVRNRYIVARTHSIGSIGALLREDAVRFARAVLALRPRLAFSIALGVIRGLSAGKLRPDRVRSAVE